MKKKTNHPAPPPLQMVEFIPKTHNQKVARRAWKSGQHLALTGFAGTGKTYLALAFALEEALKNDGKVFVVRSAVTTRNEGFLPGNQREKGSVYEDPYVENCAKLFERPDAYQLLKAQHKLEFKTTGFWRGMSLTNSTVILDEAQNFSFHELDTMITRLGDGCRFILCGDTYQDDLTSKRFNEQSGLPDFLTILQRMEPFTTVEMGIDDIVRGPLVKLYITTKMQQVK